MDTKLNSSLTKAWKEQIRQVAARNPRLARQLWQNRQAYFDRFAHFYQQLANLPRKFRRKFLRRLATTLAGAALLLALSSTPAVHAATITVTPGAAGLNPTDGCSLVEAIINANNDAATHAECTAGSGADTITLGGNTYSYTAAFGTSVALPDITSNITIEANAATIQRTGGVGFGILRVNTPGDLTLNEATITGAAGVSGGGIYNNSGTVTLNNSTLSGNSANAGGGIFNIFGALTLNNSTLSGNSASASGGGIFNLFSTTVTLNNSTLSGNSATSDGGGIYNFLSTVTLYNSTLSGNSATSDGGGIYNYGTLTVIVNNSTLSGNSATSNGGGIFNNGPLTLNRSLISGNNALTGSEVDNSDIVTANNYNVVGYSGSARSIGFTPGVNDIIPAGALATVLDTILANNGTQPHPDTHALVVGSPAIDTVAIDGVVCNPPITTDERGAVRANGPGQGGSACDSGAFEFDSNQTPTALVLEVITTTAGGDSSGVIAAVAGTLSLAMGSWWLWRQRTRQRIRSG